MMFFFRTRSSFELEAAQEGDGSSDDNDIIMAQSSDEEEDEGSSSSGKDVPAPSAETEVRESIDIQSNPCGRLIPHSASLKACLGPG